MTKGKRHKVVIFLISPKKKKVPKIDNESRAVPKIFPEEKRGNTIQELYVKE